VFSRGDLDGNCAWLCQGHRASHGAPSDLALSELREPALYQVEPGGARGSEVKDEAGVSEKPALDGRGLVGGVAVENEVDVQVGGHFTVDRLQEPLELDGAVAGVQGADEVPRGDIQGGEQAGGAVALIVVRRPRGGPGQQRKDGSRTVKRLDLALLIHTEDQRALRGVEIEPHHVAHLLHEEGVLGELEVLDAVGLQSKGPPDPGDRGLGEPHPLNHLPGRPVGPSVRRRVLQRFHNHLLHPRIIDRPGTARAGLIHEAVQAARNEPPPLATVAAETPSLWATSRFDPSAHSKTMRDREAKGLGLLGAPGPTFELLPLTIGEFQQCCSRTTMRCFTIHMISINQQRIMELFETA